MHRGLRARRLACRGESAAMIMAVMSNNQTFSAGPLPDAARHPHGVCPLPQLGVIRAVGEEAASFLQNQLTQDMEQLPVGQARLAAFCNAKGRMRASFVACRRSAHEFWLVCPADLLAVTLRRLSMYVLRSRLKLSDASSEIEVFGLMGESAGQAALGAADDGPFVAALPSADGTARALWLAPAGSTSPQGKTVSAGAWDFAAVRSGVATVGTAVADAFVPQMLNYESVDGVNFKKGCYPGQEVVARSQFRGAIKRRAFVAQVAGPAQAGEDVYVEGDPDQPVGLIAQAAPAPEGGTAVIVSLQLKAVDGGQSLHVGQADGPLLGGLHQPYPLLEI